MVRRACPSGEDCSRVVAMRPYRCDDCGRFCKRLHPIWCLVYPMGIEREVCDNCLAKRVKA